MVTGREGIIDPEPSVKSIGPKMDGKVRTKEKATDTIGNGKMTTLDGAVLMGRVGTGRTKGVTYRSKEVANKRVGIELTALIHADIFVWTRGRIALEKREKPIQGGGFGNTSGTDFETGEVVSDQNPASFPVVTNEISRAGEIR